MGNFYDGRMHNYAFGLFDFGGGADETFAILGPKGRGGRLFDYGVQGIIEVFNGDTLDPQVSVGTVADPDAYGEEFMITTALGADNVGCTVRSTYEDYAAGIDTYIVDPTLPKDTVFVLKCLASTGSNLTGQATPVIDVIWDW